MPIILKNNASSPLTTSISASDTGLVVADGSQFPVLTSGDYFYATLVSPAGTTEIVKVTARVSNSLTVVRAQDGSSAASFAAGALLEMRVNAASVVDLVDEHDEAAEIRIADTGGFYTSDNVEGALQEAMTRADLASDNPGKGATLVTLADSGGYYTSDNVEGALQEVGGIFDPTGSSLVGYTQGGAGSVARTVQSRLRDFVSVKDFGAVGDGVTDDTAAVQAAHDAGIALVEPYDAVYLVSAVTAKVPVFGGTYKRKVGSTGNFITIGAADVYLDCEVDMNNVGISNDRIIYNEYDGFETGQNFIARNGIANGVDSRNANNVKIRGKVIDCVQTHVFVYASTQDVTGLYIDVTVDAFALGTGQLNGGVKVHAIDGYDILSPVIRADVTLAEDASIPLSTACIELLGYNSTIGFVGYVGPDSFIRNAVVKGISRGGSIGCTIAGAPDAVAEVQAIGQWKIGLEITAGSVRSQYVSGSRASAGDGGVGPNNTLQITGSSDDARADVDLSGATNIRDAQGASIYVDSADRVTVSGRAVQTVGNHFIRLIDAAGFTAFGLRCRGDGSSGPTRAMTLVHSSATCDDLRAGNCEFLDITNFIGASGLTLDGGTFSNCRIDNSGLFIGGSPTLTNYHFDELCRITTTPFGLGAKHITIHNYVAGGASLLTLTRTGTPEGFITAAVGSVCRRDDGGAGTSLYVKESGTGSTGWVAK